MCLCRLRSAIGAAALEDFGGGAAEEGRKVVFPLQNSARHLGSLTTAIEMVFGSAAALSATFGSKVCTYASCPLICQYAPEHCTSVHAMTHTGTWPKLMMGVSRLSLQPSMLSARLPASCCPHGELGRAMLGPLKATD